MNRRAETISPLGLATLMAALHVAALARHVPIRRSSAGQVSRLIWRIPEERRATDRVSPDEAPSKPVHVFRAGQLALTGGVAVIALTLWLQVMRTNGATGL